MEEQHNPDDQENKKLIITHLFENYIIPALLPSNDLLSPVGKQITALKDHISNEIAPSALLEVKSVDDVETLLAEMKEPIKDATIKSVLVSSIEKIWRNNDRMILDNCVGITPDISGEIDDKEPNEDNVLIRWLKRLSVNPVVYIQFEDQSGKKTKGEIVGEKIKSGNIYYSSLNSFGKHALNLDKQQNLTGSDYHRMVFKCGEYIQRYHEVLAGIPPPLGRGSKRIKQIYDYMCALQEGSP